MEIGIYQAKAQLTKLVAQVERGERVVILRHGKPVAELVPTGQRNEAQINAALAGLAALKARLKDENGLVSPAEIKQWIEEGRH